MSENRARGAIWRPGVQKETVIQVFKATVTLFNVFWYRAQSWCFWKNWNEQGVVSAYNCLFHKYFFSIYFVPGIRQDIIELQMVNHVFYLQGASGFFFFSTFNKWYLYACTKLDLDFRSGQKTVQELLGPRLILPSCYWTEYRMWWESRCYNMITGLIRENQSRVSLCGWYCTSADLIIITQPSRAIRAVNEFLAPCTKCYRKWAIS